MKKAFIALLAFVMATANAQQKNIIKTNITAYAFRNLNLTYERVISKRFSVSVGYANMGKGDIPMKGLIPADTREDFKDIQVANSSFTLETRFYLGEGYGKGFYIAPYYRNTSFKADNFTYEYDVDGQTIPVKILGNAKGNSVGLLLGAQWFLGKKKNWALDWWIVGAHYGAGKGDFRGNSPRPLTTDEQTVLKSELENLDIPLVKYTTKVDANGANIYLDGPWAGFRSGLSVGYRF